MVGKVSCLNFWAAISLLTLSGQDAPKAAVQTVLTALREGWQVTCPREDYGWWNEGDMLGYAALVTRFMSSDLRQEIAFALCSALTRATPRFIPNELVGQEYFAASQAFVDEVKADVPDAEDWIGRSGNVSTWDLISIGSGGLALCGSPSLEAAEATQQLRTAALHLV